MKIEIDQNSGFCFGVINAINKAETELEKAETLYCLGDIVHNGEEVKRLNSMGLVTITHKDLENLRDCTVLLRAHGEPPSTYEIAKLNNIKIIDATCPVVLTLQKRIKKSYESKDNKSGQIVIFGKKGHAEVNGLVGQTNNNAIVISNLDEISKIDFSKPIHLYSQTTQSEQEFEQLKESIEQHIDLNSNSYKISNSICKQVSNRETELTNFAKKVDVIIFVSGQKSSNGKVLFSKCKLANPKSYFVTNLKDIKLLELDKNAHIGICGATSTPKWLMEEIANELDRKYNQ